MLYLILIFIVILSTDDSSAQSNPALVRIRMFKELGLFPKIPNSQIIKINEKMWALNGRNLFFLGKRLPPNNFIVKKTNNTYDVISVLDFNEYLAGVVSKEMPVRWPLEALKAQAVVARSYALARIKERNNKNFHLESDQQDQVFSMTDSQKTRQAVYETENTVLKMPSGEILKAFYHSDCGGETVKASAVWGERAVDSGTAKDPWCELKKSNQWTFEIAKDEFFNKLEMQDPMITQTSHFSAKSQSVPVVDQIFSVQKLREVFGFFKIRSAFDSFEISNDKVKITGQGFGHGAGLCQWGTLAQVKQGRSYIRVLEHYYPKAKLERNSVQLSLNFPAESRKNTVSN